LISLSFLRGRGRTASASEDRLARLRKVLDSFYLNDFDLNDVDAEEALSTLPASVAPERRQCTDKQQLRFPLSSPGRIAVLLPGFKLPGNIREFAAPNTAGFRSYAPNALVAPLNTALLLADDKTRGRLDLATLDTAIVVATRIDDSPLAPHHRELLWNAFQVPVFEMLLGWDGSVIGWECEVHQGLHLDPDRTLATIREGELLLTDLTNPEAPVVLARTGYSANLIADPCDCGQTSPRVLLGDVEDHRSTRDAPDAHEDRDRPEGSGRRNRVIDLSCAD